MLVYGMNCLCGVISTWDLPERFHRCSCMCRQLPVWLQILWGSLPSVVLLSLQFLFFVFCINSSSGWSRIRMLRWMMRSSRGFLTFCFLLSFIVLVSLWLYYSTFKRGNFWGERENDEWGMKKAPRCRRLLREVCVDKFCWMWYGTISSEYWHTSGTIKNNRLPTKATVIFINLT